MRAYGPIVLAALALAILVSSTRSNTLANAIVTVMIVALAGYGWNWLGGYGGQFSFGHAAFFGSGAYVDAVLQARYDVNAYVSFALAVLAGALVGLVIGYLSFRAKLRGSYFALITLAFAEVLRIIANAAPITGGAARHAHQAGSVGRQFPVPEPSAVSVDLARVRGAGDAADALFRASPLWRLSDRSARE